MKTFWKVLKVVLCILLVVVIVFTIGSIFKSCKDSDGNSKYTLPEWFPSWGVFDWGKKDDEVPNPDDTDPNNPDPDAPNPDESDPDKVEKYTVTFAYNYDGAPNDGVYKVLKDVPRGSIIDTSEFHIARARHDFIGWTIDSAGEIDFEPEHEIIADLRVYAQWREIDYFRITFDPNGGTLVGPTEYRTNKDGKLFSFPSDPTREGYYFRGWYMSTDGAGRVTENTVIYKDTTLYALWREPADYTVTFDANGGALSDNITTLLTQDNGKLASLPPAPTREGYKFAFWATRAGCGIWIDPEKREDGDENDYLFVNKVDTEYVFDTDKIVYAWYSVDSDYTGDNGGDDGDGGGIGGGNTDEDKPTPTPGVYTITFDANGGILDGESTIQTNTEGKLTSTPRATKEHYTFNGWYHSEYGRISFDTVFSADATVQARWKETSYTVTFDFNGGHALGYTERYLDCETYNYKLSSSPDMTYTIMRHGYIFNGWEDNAGNFVDPLVGQYFENTTLHARWKIDDFINGNLGTNATAEYIEPFSFGFEPDIPDCVLGTTFEHKIVFVFDSPFTKNSFDISVSFSQVCSPVFWITNNTYIFTIDAITDYRPNIDFGFCDLHIETPDETTTLVDFTVDESFYTDGNAYVIFYIETSFANYTDKELERYIFADFRVDGDSSAETLAQFEFHYAGLSRSNDILIYIYAKSPDVYIEKFEFYTTAGGMDLFPNKCSPNGGAFTFPVFFFVDEHSGNLADVSICAITTTTSADTSYEITAEVTSSVEVVCSAFRDPDSGMVVVNLFLPENGDRLEYTVNVFYGDEYGDNVPASILYKYDFGESVTLMFYAPYDAVTIEILEPTEVSE